MLTTPLLRRSIFAILLFLFAIFAAFLLFSDFTIRSHHTSPNQRLVQPTNENVRQSTTPSAALQISTGLRHHQTTHIFVDLISVVSPSTGT